jgi:AAA+ ATPase superfamily predicted ATPase
MNKDNLLPLKFLKLGRWWSSSQEIDIVGYNEESKEIIFGECKYLESKMDVDIFYKLLDKSKEVKWNNSDRKEYFILFSRNGFTDSLIELSKKRDNIILSALLPSLPY